MPKEVAAANHNADVSVNALAVALFVCTSCSSVNKFGSPLALRAAYGMAYGAWRKP
jgi:hypothetical protein